MNLFFVYCYFSTFSKLGDKEFSPRDCSHKKVKLLENRRSIDRTTLNTWVLSQLKVLKDLFPNAVIFFVIPSETYSNNDDKRSELNSAIIQKSIQSFIAGNSLNVTLIKQPSYPSIDMLCNDGLHASTNGRVWRTNNILDSLSSIK